MTSDLALQCSCGAVSGVVHDPHVDSTRLVCYCDDCQAFAHYLERASDIVDPLGGTDILQISPKRLEFTRGQDKLACMRLTPKGICRWYTKCCKTPVANTLAVSSVPFVGFILPVMAKSGPAGTEGSRGLDDRIGQIGFRLHCRFAKQRVEAPHAYGKAPVSLLFDTVGKLLKRRLRGEQRDSPFFEGKELRAPPHVLTSSELQAVVQARDAD